MIVLKQLAWDDCFSYGKNNSIDFSKNTITQLIGENGHGKSSIILILQEILFSKNSKGIKKADITNRNTSGNSYNISLSMDVDGVPYLIKHSRSGAKVTLSLFKEDEDISEHTAPNTLKKIEALIGMPFEDFCQLVYQSSDASLEFLKATDTTRKKFLISLLSLNEYSSIETKVKAILTEVSNKRVSLKSALDTTAKWLNKAKEKPLESIVLQEVPSDPEKLREEILNLRILQKEQAALREKIQVNDMNKEKATMLRKLVDIEVAKPVGDYEALVSKVADLKSKVTALVAQKKDYESTQLTCPRCNRPFEGVDPKFIQESIATLNGSLALTKQSLGDAETELSEYTKANNAYNSWLKNLAALERVKIEDLPELDTTLDTRLKQSQKELERILNVIKDATEFNLKAESHNSRLGVIKAQLDEYAADEIKLKEELEVVSAREARLEVLKLAFGTKGIVAYKIESMIKDLEDLINQYLQEFSAGRFTIQFVVSNDKLNVNLTDNGREVSISALSSGELARVNTSTLLAIRKLLNTLSKNKLNLLFLDEVLNVLDEEGRQKLIAILSEEEDLNSFIVSHGWYHPLVARMRVVKTDGVSTVTED